MEAIMQNIPSHGNLQTLLRRSIELYLQIENVLSSLKDSLNDTAKSGSSEQVDSFLYLQSEVVTCDTQVMDLLSREQTADNHAIMELIRQRLLIMQRVFTLNREILPQAEGIKALRQSELKNITLGRGALKGYTKSGKNDQTFFSGSY